MQPQVSSEPRRPIKVFTGTMFVVSVIIVVAAIINEFIPFGFQDWMILVGAVCYVIGMICRGVIND